MRNFPLSELHRSKGDIVDAALREPITLTKHGKRKLVVMSAEHYDELTTQPQDPRISRYMHETPPDEARLLVEALEAQLSRLESGHGE
jgi:prevent-host-death family protein